MERLLLGIKTWRYGSACPLSEAIRRSADMGFGFVDISFHFIGYEGKVYYWPKEVAPSYRHEIGDLLRGHGLRAGIILPSPQRATAALLSPLKIEDVAEVSAFDDRDIGSLSFIMEQGIEAARGIGAELVDELHCEPPDRWKVYDEVKPVLKAAAQHDLRIGLENKNESTPDQILSVLRELGANDLGVSFDVGHAYEFLRDSEKVAELVVELGESIIHAHIHDFTADVHHAYVGQGEINWIKIIRAFKSIGYGGSLTLEISPEEGNRLTLPPHPDLEILRCKWLLEYLARDA